MIICKVFLEEVNNDSTKLSMVKNWSIQSDEINGVRGRMTLNYPN